MTDPGARPPREPHALRQLAAFAGGPVAVLVSMQVKYALVPWACSHGTAVVLHAIAFGGFAIAAASVIAAYGEWRSVGGAWPDDEGGVRGRTRFLGMLALLLGAAALIVILAQWVPELILSPCSA